MNEEAAPQDARLSASPTGPQASASPNVVIENAQEQTTTLVAAEDAMGQQEQFVAPPNMVVNHTESDSVLQSKGDFSNAAASQSTAAPSDLQQDAAAESAAGSVSAAAQGEVTALSPAVESAETDSQPEKPSSPEVTADAIPDLSIAAPADTSCDIPPAALADATDTAVSTTPALVDDQAVQQPDLPPPAFANATFTVPTEKWHHQQSVPLATTAAEIKHSLCSNWNIAETALSVKLAGCELQDSESLSSCGIQAGADVEIELVIHYQMLATKRKTEAVKVAVLPERFEVKVFQGSESEAKLVTVRVDVTQKQSKQYQGGYRDKRNGALYHHADSQTDKQASDKANTQRFERECQTVATKQRGGQTNREAHVQMARPDLLLDTSRDRFLSPRKYMTADEVWAVKERCAATIQRFTRGWLARIRVRFMLKEARQGTAAANRAAAEAAAQESALKRFEAQRRLQPHSPADFALLHSELAAWHQAETARIKAADLLPEERHLAFCHLLHQETKLLQSVDRLKAEADLVAHEQRIAGALASMATPKQWSLSNGGLLDVHTPATTRAAELRGLYRGLQLVLGAGERLDVLLHVKCKVKEFDTSLTKELLQLIEREADLINRGRKAATMEGLRKRISTLFLQFIESPAFNPEAANFFNLSPKSCSSETYMYGSMTAADKAGIAVNSLLV